VVRVVVRPPADTRFDEALAITGDVLRRAGFKVDKGATAGSVYSTSRERTRVNALLFLPSVTVFASRCRGDDAFGASIHARSADDVALQQRIVGDVESGLARAFGRPNVSVEDGTTLCP
jgi:hypothetical protein